MASFPPDRPASVGHEAAMAESPPEGERRESAPSGILFPASSANPSAMLLSEVAQLNANYARLRRIRTSSSAQHSMIASYSRGAHSPHSQPGSRDSAQGPVTGRYGPSTIGRNLLDATKRSHSPLTRASSAQEHATPPPPQPLPLAQEGPHEPHKQQHEKAHVQAQHGQAHGQSPDGQAHGQVQHGKAHHRTPHGQEQNGQVQNGPTQHAQLHNGPMQHTRAHSGQMQHSQAHNGQIHAGQAQHTQAEFPGNRQAYQQEYLEHNQRPQEIYGSPAVSLSTESSPSPSASPAAPPSPSDVDRLMLLVREKQGQTHSPAPESVEQWRHKCHFEGCGKAFKQKAHLQTHLRSHTGERPFACPFPQCGKTFSQQCNLRAHVRAHTGERPFKCPVCAKGFSQQGNMRNHMLIHYNDHPIECRLDGCDRRFNQLGNLKAHQNTAHKEAVHAFTEKLKNGSNLDDMEPKERELFDHFCNLYKNANRGIRGRGKGTKSIVGRESPGGAFSYGVSPQPTPSPTSPHSHAGTPKLEASPSLSGPASASSDLASPVVATPMDTMQQPTPVEPYQSQLANSFASVPQNLPQHASSMQQPPPPQLAQQPLHSAQQPIDSLNQSIQDPAQPLTHTIQQQTTVQQPIHYQPQTQQIQLPTQLPGEEVPQQRIQQPQQMLMPQQSALMSQSSQVQPYVGPWDGRQFLPSDQLASSMPMMVPDCSPYQYGVAPPPQQGYTQQYPFSNGAM